MHSQKLVMVHIYSNLHISLQVLHSSNATEWDMMCDMEDMVQCGHRAGLKLAPGYSCQQWSGGLTKHPQSYIQCHMPGAMTQLHH